jgi:peptidoglycan pentaglycine glycine transferase (the first glycine)
MTLLSASDWDVFIHRFPETHLLQTSAWGELKAAFSWNVERVNNGEAGVQILFRRLPLGLTLAYIPKGPVGVDWQKLWPEVDALCRKRHAVFLKVEPDLWEPVEKDKLEWRLPGFIPSQQAIQPRRTVLIDLNGSEEEILGRMKQKTRYNIRLAQKKGVQVSLSTNLEGFYSLMQVTGERDGFGVHSLEYYRQVYSLFSQTDHCCILQANYNETPLAALMVFVNGRQAWYFYGASNDQERNRMPTYLLQWEAIRWARLHGCAAYDLWGVPDFDEKDLEDQFEQRHDGLWGVYRFKRGFGGELKRSVGAWDKIYQPLIYALYLGWLRLKGMAGNQPATD